MNNDTSLTEGDETYRKKLIFVTSFFLITPIILAISALSFLYLGSHESKPTAEIVKTASLPIPLSGARVYASLPSSFPSISGDVISKDSRAGLIEKYLVERESPLAVHASYIVETAERFGLDYRLTTAIAQKESGLCRVIPEGTFNCWGWGIHSQGTLGFGSFEEGIETVSKGLKDNYIDKGYTTIDEIMAKYTPLSSGTWADGVGYYMNQIIEN